MTYCGAIEAQLMVAVCPLGAGQCMWQHRANHDCKYTTADLTPEQFAELVGAPSYDHQKVREQLAQEVQRGST